MCSYDAVAPTPSAYCHRCYVYAPSSTATLLLRRARRRCLVVGRTARGFVRGRVVQPGVPHTGTRDDRAGLLPLELTVLPFRSGGIVATSSIHSEVLDVATIPPARATC